MHVAGAAGNICHSEWLNTPVKLIDGGGKAGNKLPFTCGNLSLALVLSRHQGLQTSCLGTCCDLVLRSDATLGPVTAYHLLWCCQSIKAGKLSWACDLT